MNGFKERLKRLRETAGFTQLRLAVCIGVTRDQIYNWESGRGEPNIGQIIKLANAMRITTDHLLIGPQNNTTEF